MVDITQGDICRYYGGTRPVNGLGGGEGRNLAQMGVGGHFEAGYYIPEPSVRTFEAFLAKVLAARPCAGCGKPRGYGPVIALDHRFYHPPCGRIADFARSPAPPFAGRS